jgi:inner membrane protein
LATGKKEDAYTFDFDLGIDGSQDLKVVPMGQQTTVTLSSPWPSPSFSGAFLPESSKVTPPGVPGPLERLRIRPQLPPAVAP